MTDHYVGPHNEIHASTFLFLISLPSSVEFDKERVFVKKTITALKELGVHVFERIDRDILSSMVNYKYVIVVAHHDEGAGALVLQDKCLKISEFISFIPEQFSGTLDLSACYSANVMARIKERTNYKCKVQSMIKQTTLALRLIMYPHLVRLMISDHTLDYGEAYEHVLGLTTLSFSQIDNSQRKEEHKELKKAVKLGDNFSSIYAPSQVERNKAFLINIFFHKDEETDSVQLLAQRVDPNTSLVDTQIIPINLCLKDRLTTRLTINNGSDSDINVNNGIDTKSVIWLNRPAKIQYMVIVENDYLENSFICEVKIEVNSEPVGECLFVIGIADKESQMPCSIHLRPYDQQSERNLAKARLKKLLESNLKRLELEIKKSLNEDVRASLMVQYDVCNKCLRLIENVVVQDFKDSIKKVFISSTSDMAQYRDVVKNEIISCGMFPIDYRTWLQSDMRPSDICCQKVLESDACLCIIGARYGYIDPAIGISMTQMEYETALMAGKKILVYVLDPLEDSNEDETFRLKQLEFINQIRSSRILKFFSDDYALSKDATRELSFFK